MRWLLVSLFLIVPFLSIEAEDDIQEKTDTCVAKKKHQGFKNFLKRMTDYDTTYISPNKYHAAFMMMGEKRFSFYNLQSDTDNGTQELQFSPSSPFRVGPYIGYSLFFLGYTFDVGAKQSSITRSNVYLSLYAPWFGIDYFYESDTHNYQLKRAKGFNNEEASRIKDLHFGGMSTYFQNIHLYYIFNNRHFSYPAAYSQSTNQIKSCGSFMLGFNYTFEKVNFDYTKLPAALLYDENGNEILNENLKISNVYYRDYSISLGFAYNAVFAKNCLANLTFSPTLGYNFSKGEKFNTREKLFNLDALNFDFISRASIVWNNSKYFVGASVVAHTYTYKKPTFSVRNALITLSIYSGFNFLRKKKYKNDD